ncbi:MAG: D-glycero-alpha-D-manno-heptose-1,7-bisphosphate 7-phosphatase [Marinifilaceae bacterium]
MNKKRQIQNKKVKQKAVFFDRDGTINSDEGHYYVYKVKDFVFNPGVISGMKRLQDAGYLLFVITNQGGVAKEIYTKEEVEELHQYMEECLAKEGVKLSKIYYCPHHESIKTCVCRKPSPYMVNLAIDEYNIDRAGSYFIGDSSRDVKCAEAANIKPIKIIKNQDVTPCIDKILKTSKPVYKPAIIIDDDF